MPFRPAMLDFSATAQHKKTLEDRGFKVVPVVSCIEQRKKAHREAFHKLKKQSIVYPFSMRSCVEESINDYRTLFYGQIKRTNAVLSAQYEIEQIYNEAMING